MKKYLLPAAWPVCLFFCSGCASVMNGPSQEVSISSNPSGAAIIVDGETIGATPLIVVLSRKKRYRIRLSREGYLPYEMSFSRKVSGLVAGDFALGVGPLGLLADRQSGAMYKLSPGQLNVALKKETVSNP
ncbi:MAG: PEGA domain-containing protein [Puia sp.]|nr:PEGA domain-containing protein [Puia sp.]